MVDTTPLARPMLAVLGEYPRACVLVVNREAAPVWEMYQDEMREVQTVTDPLRKAGNTGGSRPEDRIQNRVDEQAKRHFRRAASMIDQLLRSDGYDILVVGGHEYELGEFFRLLPHELRGRVAGTFSADPIATPVAEIRSSAEGVMRRYQHEQDQRLVAHVLELAAAGGLAALGPQDCLWAGSMSAIDTLLVRDGATLVGVVCDESRWLAASGDICPVCGKPTRSRPGRPGRARGGRHRDRRLGQADRGGPHARRVPDGGAAAVPASPEAGRGRQETASHEDRESRELTVKVIVYGDFNSVHCFLASQRADRLTREGKADVEWRAVEHLPRLPVTGYKPRPARLRRAAWPGRTTWPKPRSSRCPASSCPPGPRP